MFKLHRSLLILGLGLLCPLAAAQPATYESGILRIPQGAAIVDGEPTYYNDIQLLSDIEGNFTLLAAQQSNLVAVDSVIVNIMESFPIQVSVTVSGNKSLPCVELQTPAIFREGFTFTIVLAETTLGPAESCIAVLDPFETNISLDVNDLDSGSYIVTVNGIATSFSL